MKSSKVWITSGLALFILMGAILLNILPIRQPLMNSNLQRPVTDNATMAQVEVVENTKTTPKKDLTLKGSINGSVVDAKTNEPKPGITVIICASYVSDNEMEKIIAKTTSNQQGDFSIKGLEEGAYKVTIHEQKMVCLNEPLVTVWNDKPAPQITLQVTTGGVIRGRVYCKETSKGIPGMLIETEWGAVVQKSTTSKLDGTYEISGLPRFNGYIVCQSTTDLYFLEDAPQKKLKRINIHPGQVIEDADFPISELDRITVRGRVMDNFGNPVEAQCYFLRL